MAEPEFGQPTRTVLSVAGSDCVSMAGLQADLKTAGAFGVHLCTAVTAVTVQTHQEVRSVHPLSPETVLQQVQAAADTLSISAVKFGLLADAKVAQRLADFVSVLAVPVVIDPVLGASAGSTFGDDRLLTVYREQLLPFADLLTPNALEAATLLGVDRASDQDEAERQALALLSLGAKNVLLKGGHMPGAHVVDVLATPDGVQSFAAPRIETLHARGTGCTLSTAIAAGLAQGLSLKQSVSAAKAYVQGALAHSARLQLVDTDGPLHHFYQYW